MKLIPGLVKPLKRPKKAFNGIRRAWKRVPSKDSFSRNT